MQFSGATVVGAPTVGAPVSTGPYDGNQNYSPIMRTKYAALPGLWMYHGDEIHKEAYKVVGTGCGFMVLGWYTNYCCLCPSIFAMGYEMSMLKSKEDLDEQLLRAKRLRLWSIATVVIAWIMWPYAFIHFKYHMGNLWYEQGDVKMIIDDDIKWSNFGDGTQYKVFPLIPRSWQDAQDFCKGQGGSLALLDTNAKTDFVKDHLLKNVVSEKENADCVGNFWFGLHEIGNITNPTFGWADTDEALDENEYSNWHDDDPGVHLFTWVEDEVEEENETTGDVETTTTTDTPVIVNSNGSIINGTLNSSVLNDSSTATVSIVQTSTSTTTTSRTVPEHHKHLVNSCVNLASPSRKLECPANHVERAETTIMRWHSESCEDKLPFVCERSGDMDTYAAPYAGLVYNQSHYIGVHTYSIPSRQQTLLEAWVNWFVSFFMYDPEDYISRAYGGNVFIGDLKDAMKVRITNHPEWASIVLENGPNGERHSDARWYMDDWCFGVNGAQMERRTANSEYEFNLGDQMNVVRCFDQGNFNTDQESYFYAMRYKWQFDQTTKTFAPKVFSEKGRIGIGSWLEREVKFANRTSSYLVGVEDQFRNDSKVMTYTKPLTFSDATNEIKEKMDWHFLEQGFLAIIVMVFAFVATVLYHRLKKKWIDEYIKALEESMKKPAQQGYDPRMAANYYDPRFMNNSPIHPLQYNGYGPGRST